MENPAPRSNMRANRTTTTTPTRPDHPVRQRTVFVASIKGGVTKTSLSSALAYEAARMGLTVLVVDSDGTGGFSSATNSYAEILKNDEGIWVEEPSITDAILGGFPAPVRQVENWTPNPDIPWVQGGPAIPGGRIFISPVPPSKSGRASITEVISEPGITKENRLSKVLENSDIANLADLVIVDMPGTDNPAAISAMLYAAEHVIFPLYPAFFAFEALEGLDTRIDTWAEASGKIVNYLGAIPTAIPTKLLRNPDEREVLIRSAWWLEDTFDGALGVMAPGIEHRKAFPRAQQYALPVTQLASTRQELRDLGNLPAALTKTALTMLANMRPEADDPETLGRKNYDVEAMKQAVLSHDMPDEWRAIIEGPHYIDYEAEWVAHSPELKAEREEELRLREA